MNITKEAKAQRKNKKLLIIIIALIALLIILLFCFLIRDNKTAVIVNADTETKLQNVDTTNQLRIKINPAITVSEDTLQNIDFYNLNQDRYLQCKIKIGSDYVYESQLLAEGEMIKADIVDDSKLKKGQNEGTAEVYSYDMDRQKIAQTNVKIVLLN